MILLLRHPGRRPRRLNRLNTGIRPRRRPRPAPPAAATAVAAAQCPVHPWSHPPRPHPPPLTHPPTSLRPRRERLAGGIILNRTIYGTVAAGSIHEEALKSCRLFWFPRHDAGATGGGAADFTGGLPTLRGGGSARGPWPRRYGFETSVARRRDPLKNLRKRDNERRGAYWC